MEQFSEKPPVVGESGEPVSEADRLWALAAHLCHVVGFSALGPLVIWLLKKDSSPFVADQAKEALNFQLSCLVTILLTAATCVLAPLAIVAVVGGMIYSILGGAEAYKGCQYRYPYTFRPIQ